MTNPTRSLYTSKILAYIVASVNPEHLSRSQWIVHRICSNLTSHKMGIQFLVRASLHTINNLISLGLPSLHWNIDWGR